MFLEQLIFILLKETFSVILIDVDFHSYILDDYLAPVI
jgi:hypothetical protein